MSDTIARGLSKNNSDKIGLLTNLQTTEKTDLVKAINENTVQLADISSQTYITEKAKTVDVNNALALKADKTEVNSLATGKADKTYVDTVTQSIASGSPKGIYNTVAELTAAFPTGNTNIYLVLGNVKEVASLTISSVPTTVGNVTITLNGVATNIAVDPATDTTTALVATKIRNTVFPSGAVTGGTGSAVTFTASTGGAKTDALYSAGTTGASGTMTTTTQGVDPDGKWYYWNSSAWTAGGVYQSTGIASKSINHSMFKDKSVIPDKIYGVQHLINLFNKKNTKQGWIFYAGENGAFKEIPGENFWYGTEKPMPVEPSTQYSVTNAQAASAIAYYDSSMNLISSIGGRPFGKYTFTTPANCYYVRINIDSRSVSVDQYMMTLSTEYPAEFAAYESNIDWLRVEAEQIKGLLTLAQLNGVTKTVNLFDKENAKQFWVFDAGNNGVLVELPSEPYWYGTEIPINVKPSTQYSVTNAQALNAIAFYDSSMNLVSSIGNRPSGIYTFTTPSNCYYMRLNIDSRIISVDDYMVTLSPDYPQEYVPYGYSIKNLVSDTIKSNAKNGKWSGKTLYLFGDSITYWDNRYSWFDPEYLMRGYPTHLREQLAVTTVNKGFAGYTMSQIKGVIQSTALTSAYSCIITGGHNDALQGGQVGTINDAAGTATYIGSLKSAIEYCYSQNPKIKIYLLAPIKSMNYDTVPFADAMEQVGNLYGIPVLRMDKQVQINSFNQSTLLVDGVHPNNDGYVLLGDVIVPFLVNN